MKKEEFELEWFIDYDENDNKIWEAVSPWHDDGSPYCYRIKQRLIADEHEYYEASDADIISDEEIPRVWTSLEEAQREFQEDANEVIKNLVIEEIVDAFQVWSKFDDVVIHLHSEASKLEKDANHLMMKGNTHEAYRGYNISQSLRVAANYLDGVAAS